MEIPILLFCCLSVLCVFGLVALAVLVFFLMRKSEPDSSASQPETGSASSTEELSISGDATLVQDSSMSGAPTVLHESVDDAPSEPPETTILPPID